MRLAQAATAVLMFSALSSCGGGTGTTDPPPPPPRFTSWIVSPETVIVPGSATASWTTTYTTSCYSVSVGTLPVSGSFTVTLNAVKDSTISIDCTGAGGTVKSPPVTIHGIYPLPRATIAISPDTIYVGEKSARSWSCQNSTGGTVSGTPSATSVAGSDSLSPSSAGRYDYTLVCTGAGGVDSSKVTLTALDPVVFFGKVYSVLSGSAGITDSRAYVRLGSVVDSADISADGSFRVLSLRFIHADSVDGLIDEKNSANRQFDRALTALRKSDFRVSQGLVRIPRNHTIQAGAFAGQSVSVDVVDAYTLAKTGDLSFYQRDLQPNGTWKYWSARIPAGTVLPFAFDRAHSNQPPDSLGFSAGVDTLARRLGVSSFRPANIADLSAEGLYIKVDSTIAQSALAGAFFSPVNDVTGNITGCGMIFKVTFFMGPANGPATIHELIHCLGFGHTCGWIGVMSSPCPSGMYSFTGPTARDIGYIELYYAVSQVRTQTGARLGLAEAFEGEKEIRGLPRAMIWRP